MAAVEAVHGGGAALVARPVPDSDQGRLLRDRNGVVKDDNPRSVRAAVWREGAVDFCCGP